MYSHSTYCAVPRHSLFLSNCDLVLSDHTFPALLLPLPPASPHNHLLSTVIKSTSLDSPYKWNYMVLFFLYVLFHLTIVSYSIHIILNYRISLFSLLNNIQCVCTVFFHSSSSWWTPDLFTILTILWTDLWWTWEGRNIYLIDLFHEC